MSARKERFTKNFLSKFLLPSLFFFLSSFSFFFFLIPSILFPNEQSRQNHIERRHIFNVNYSHHFYGDEERERERKKRNTERRERERERERKKKRERVKEEKEMRKKKIQRQDRKEYNVME